MASALASSSSSSKPCAIKECKRSSRALCHCCSQNLCLEHLKEHDDLLNAQLNPLTDEINVLRDKLLQLKEPPNLQEERAKLDVWRRNAIQTIDQYYERKCQELDAWLNERLDKQRYGIERMRAKITGLLREQDATRQDIDSLKHDIQLAQAPYQPVVDIRALIVNENLIKIRPLRKPLHISRLKTPNRSVDMREACDSGMATDEQYLLIGTMRNLYLLDQRLKIEKKVKWNHDTICDICYSVTLSKFIFVGRDGALTLDARKMHIEQIFSGDFSSCTCSETSLYVSTDEMGPVLSKYDFSKNLQLSQAWKSPTTFTQEENILSLSHRGDVLALLIFNRSSYKYRLDARSSGVTTLDTLWSLPLESITALGFRVRVRSLNVHGWLVINPNDQEFIHISTTGEIQSASAYSYDRAWDALVFGTDSLAVVVDNGLKMHKLF